MNNQRSVYINGVFVPESEAKISIFDSALMFGDMVFEMTRSFNKEQFRLREHLERLYRGLRILQIPIKQSIEELEQICLETIEINEIESEMLKNFYKDSKISISNIKNWCLKDGVFAKSFPSTPKNFKQLFKE